MAGKIHLSTPMASVTGHSDSSTVNTLLLVCCLVLLPLHVEVHVLCLLPLRVEVLCLLPLRVEVLFLAFLVLQSSH